MEKMSDIKTRKFIKYYFETMRQKIPEEYHESLDDLVQAASEAEFLRAEIDAMNGKKVKKIWRSRHLVNYEERNA